MTLNANHLFIGLGLFVLGYYMGKQAQAAAAQATASNNTDPAGQQPWLWAGA
jgi:hypothetical protein